MKWIPCKRGETSERKKRGPYDLLYIYHLRGKVNSDEERGFGIHFLGNRVEGDSSFLFETITGDG